jgi:hypothetical protein
MNADIRRWGKRDNTLTIGSHDKALVGQPQHFICANLRESAAIFFA